MSEYTVWFFVLVIVTSTWAIMSLMTVAMLTRFKAVNDAEGLRLLQERAKVSCSIPRYLVEHVPIFFGRLKHIHRR